MSLQSWRWKYRRRSRVRGLFIALFVFAMTTFLGWLLIWPGWQARLFGVQAQGVVQDISVCSDSGGGEVALRGVPLLSIQDNVQPTVQFTDRQGQTHVVNDVICGSYGIGEQVTLWYLPSNPTTFSLENDKGTLMLFTILDAPAAAVSLLFVLWLALRFFLLVAVGARAASQGNAYVGGFPQMGGQMGGAPQMWGGQMSGAPQMWGGQVGGGGNHRRGEAVAVDGRWTITLTDAYPSQGEAHASAAPGRYDLMLWLTLYNTSAEPLNFGQTAFRLYDVAGVEYQRVPAIEGSMPGLIQPGSSESAGLAFDVPGTLRQFRLGFYPPAAFTAQANWDIAV
jgi:hypothetical protein